MPAVSVRRMDGPSDTSDARGLHASSSSTSRAREAPFGTHHHGNARVGGVGHGARVHAASDRVGDARRLRRLLPAHEHRRGAAEKRARLGKGERIAHLGHIAAARLHGGAFGHGPPALGPRSRLACVEPHHRPLAGRRDEAPPRPARWRGGRPSPPCRPSPGPARGRPAAIASRFASRCRATRTCGSASSNDTRPRTRSSPARRPPPPRARPARAAARAHAAHRRAQGAAGTPAPPPRRAPAPQERNDAATCFSQIVVLQSVRVGVAAQRGASGTQNRRESAGDPTHCGARRAPGTARPGAEAPCGGLLCRP